MRIVETGVSGYVNCFCYIAHAFWAETIISKNFMEFFVSANVCLCFCCYTPYT